MAVGNIDIIIAGRVEGWLFTEQPLTRPYITVDGQPARILRTDVPRPDVGKALGVDGTFGFIAELPGSCHGPTTVALYAVDRDRVRFVKSRRVEACHNDGFSPLDLEAAIATAREPGSVAIVVWDAAHNPAGRAKVLYDIVASQRPAVLFGFCHSEFGDQLWQPLQSSAIRSYLVRPGAFERFRNEARAIGLTFDTIWLCKPRLPTFVLAEALAHPGTAMVLDIDDNEEAFSRGKSAWGRWYGETTVNKAALYRDRLPVRSVASVSLQARFGGEIVRHVREPLPAPPVAEDAVVPVEESGKAARPFRLVFIGTVRPHKGLLEAARAIRMAAFQHHLEISLTVGGTFDPPSLKADLAALGVSTVGVVPSTDLVATLREFDAVLTGYPSSESFADVNIYQISSKIGDALQSGIPVLVPRSPATDDLNDMPGVHLFDADTFGSVLHRLVKDDHDAPALPDSFSVAKAYETFRKLEAQAQALRLLQDLPEPQRQHGRNIVILWKQNDSGLYGRRVDQVARALAERIEGACVRIVEFAEPRALTVEDPKSVSTSAEVLCMNETRRKLNDLVRNGVHHHAIVATPRNAKPTARDGETSSGFGKAFEEFLQSHEIYSANTVVIAFPLHYLLDAVDDILPIIRRFQIIVDVVDNQLSWATTKLRPEKIAHYRAYCDLARSVIFNSATNRDAMLASGIVDEAKVRQIPNWYVPPRETSSLSEIWRLWSVDEAHVLYSGDLNNRIDWELFDSIAALIGALGGVLHVIGTAQKVPQELSHILRRPQCVYHGPMREEAVIEIARTCRFAVIPHVHDELSSFMNPLKIKMYESIGLAHIVTNVPGVDSTSRLTVVAQDHDDFLAKVRILFHQTSTVRTDRSDAPEEMIEYCALVEEAFATITQKYSTPTAIAAQ